MGEEARGKDRKGICREDVEEDDDDEGLVLHKLTTRSLEAEIKYFPSGLMANCVTGAVCPSNLRGEGSILLLKSHFLIVAEAAKSRLSRGGPRQRAVRGFWEESIFCSICPVEIFH